MKKFFLILSAMALLCACHTKNTDPTPEPYIPDGPEAFAKGADISWATEMESKGMKFYNEAGEARECTALFKEIGFNSVRYRVWVNPTDGWCNKDDVLLKAKRAQALGMNILIDFHYSDWWADPGKQNIPAAWKDYDLTQMASAVSDHTKEVLRCLKDNKIDVKWVQVGNETRTGMLWPMGKLTDDNPFNYCTLSNAGYDAVKSIYPDAIVIIHNDNGWDISLNNWFWALIGKGGAKYDMIGLSLYPSYWDDASKSYPDWTVKCRQFVSNIVQIHSNFSKPVMLVEFGMPVSQPDKAETALQFIIDGTSSYDWFKGIFLWEPESETARNGYDYGAFADGKPTSALNPFKN